MTGVWRTRPGADELAPATADRAFPIGPGIWMSPGLSNSYLIVTDEGRIVINTGMGFEGPVHRANFDAVDSSPVRFVILTQGHYDHVGGIEHFLDTHGAGLGTDVIAHESWRTWRDDNERLAAFRAANSAFAFLDRVLAGVAATKDRFPHASTRQGVPHPTIEVSGRLTMIIGGRPLEIIPVRGGETTDSLVVWLPEERILFAGNTFGPLFAHLPNLVTIRGDRYRDALTVIATIEKVRELGAEVLITGHFEPVFGADLIDGELTRLRDAVQYLHDETVAGMNAGTDVHTLMRTIALPEHLDIGEGYGKASWDVRAIWENYAGWFHHRSTTELYDVPASAVHADVVELAGADAILSRAAERLAAGQPLEAIHLAEMVPTDATGAAEARRILREAHGYLLERSTNFWESSWLTRQIERNA
ncbi:MAG TPA: MBL fold metallo-hydrolase [Marmoricola sp.]|jgi:alkyl sulfatase BDS1-like metallo-beta-lactamase superfamily hydrolase|nr:MBL fold metallo-hydrolase [Marmoricola sp.]